MRCCRHAFCKTRVHLQTAHARIPLLKPNFPDEMALAISIASVSCAVMSPRATVISAPVPPNLPERRAPCVVLASVCSPTAAAIASACLHLSSSWNWIATARLPSRLISNNRVAYPLASCWIFLVMPSKSLSVSCTYCPFVPATAALEASCWRVIRSTLFPLLGIPLALQRSNNGFV